MGFGDPDHHHPLKYFGYKKDAVCFRCELPTIGGHDGCYGCTRCNHFVHDLCLSLPENMRHPHHPQHSLTLLPSLSSSSSTTQTITDNCNQCLEPFIGGYAYHCDSCLKFNLHLKCFVTLNLEKKHHHPLRLTECYDKVDCRICGLLIDHSDGYAFACVECEFFIHSECTFVPPTVKHRHVHELTFEYNYPEGSKIFDCDVCLGKDDDEELDRRLSYYYCERCDYIAHVRCVTSEPVKVTTQFDHSIHEHPMLFFRRPNVTQLTCAACKHTTDFKSFYFCGICNYAIHKSCAQFPRFMKHPLHKEDHTLSLQYCASQIKDCKLICCEFCTKELEGQGWIFHCSDCEFSVHFACAIHFQHPLYGGKIFFFSTYEAKIRCNACGELGGGFRMSNRDDIDLHVECFSLPGQIEHGCHSHPLYLVNSPTEIESDLSSVFQCDMCHTEADPDYWVYCCIQCKYIAHLKCAVRDLLPAPGLPCTDFSNVCFIKMCEKEKFRVRKTKLDQCSKLLKETYYKYPFFLPCGFFFNRKVIVEDHNRQSIESDVTDLHKTDVLCCPKCQEPISAQANSSVWDWVHHNLKPSIYKIQIETLADSESLAQLDENVVDELYCPICNLLIFPPTYSCSDCQIFFHKSCAELPRKYTMDSGHTLVLHSPSINNNSFSNCSKCKHPCKGYAYFCTSCNIGLDVTCALGSPLLKLDNHKHSLFASSEIVSPLFCNACHQRQIEENIYLRCGADCCSFNLHIECALLSHVVKHRIHQHPLVLEPYLDLSVDDYICDVCEKELNPCIWVYRCSDSCGDRATSHVSCIVTSSKKKCHFVYDEECTYPHLDKVMMEELILLGEYTFPKRKMKVQALAAAIVNEPHSKENLLNENLFLFVDELEHDYADHVTYELMEMGQTEIFHLMESPDALSAKVAELVKDLTSLDKEKNAENDEHHSKSL